MTATIGTLAFMAGVFCSFAALFAKLRGKRAQNWVGGFAWSMIAAIGLWGFSGQQDGTPSSQSVAAEATVAPKVAAAVDTSTKTDDSTPEPAADEATTAPVADERTPKPEPTLSRQQQKRAFLATVDESITGQRIAGNPAKFLGNNVDLHGEVINVLDAQTFNFRTGGVRVSDDGTYTDTQAVILVKCDSTSDLEANQKLGVIGTVDESTDGTNAMGGSMSFPTVKAEFME